jgi:predicted RNase H-like HicB family nuclease
MKYAVIFERGSASYGAYVPDLPGCIAVGKTLAETRKLIREAIDFHVDGMILHGEDVPAPSTRVGVVSVNGKRKKPMSRRLRASRPAAR